MLRKSLIITKKSITVSVANIAPNSEASQTQKRGIQTNAFTNIISSYTSGSLSTGLSVTALTILGGIGWASTRYIVAKPNEYLVKTGIFIPNIDISKKTFHFPYQTLNTLYLEPSSYHCVIEEAMSQERIAFNMPTVFTIGPEDTDEALKKICNIIFVNISCRSEN